MPEEDRAPLAGLLIKAASELDTTDNRVHGGSQESTQIVLRGLDPRIHAFFRAFEGVDGRDAPQDAPGQDEPEADSLLYSEKISLGQRCESRIHLN